MMDLSILIVNWNAKEYLKDCLNSIYTGVKNIAFEIIVVDNLSSDNSREMIKKEFVNVILIENNINNGYGKANNQAIQVSNGQYILVLNPDTIIYPGSLEILTGYLETHPEVGAVGPKIRNSDGSIQYECARHMPTPLTELFSMSTLDKRFPKSKIFGRYLMSYWDHNDLRKVDLLSGACMMLRKRVFDEIGKFDESFFMYAEEPDLFMRIKKAGWEIHYLPSAEIKHLWGKSAKQIPIEMAVESRISMEIFFRKYYGVMSVIAHRITVMLISAIFTILWIFAYIVSTNEKRTKAKNLYMANIAMFCWSAGIKWKRIKKN